MIGEGTFPRLSSNNVQLLGEILDYNSPLDELILAIKRALSENFMVGISNFKPAIPEELIKFAQLIGKPVQKHGADGKLDQHITDNQQPEYVNSVAYMKNIEESKRTPTQNSSALSMHTARAYSKIKPSFFTMLMVTPGWINNSPGHNGESLLVRWKDVISEFRERYPATASNDIHVLETTSIAYNPWYITQTPDNSPILQRLTSDPDDYSVRAWEDLANKAQDLEIDNKKNYVDTLNRFHEVANSCKKMIEFNMGENFLVILDNKRVAHGRRDFVSTKRNEDGALEYNPRKMLTIGIH